MDALILVDEEDRETGFEEKKKCHLVPTKLHRAFSVFILNEKGEMLVHRRAQGKKTWPAFWTNACCSHPRKGESLEMATQRRLREELGFSCPLTHLFTFRYQADFDSIYGENEIDHVFAGTYGGPVKPDPEEIGEWMFMPVEELWRDVEARPKRYTPWFRIALPKVIKHLKKTMVNSGVSIQESE
jgi:isopentenyl-diphosphate Delta-isomerase